MLLVVYEQTTNIRFELKLMFVNMPDLGSQITQRKSF